jgi:2-C-methyl-D-erythritol 4-phosphate cytidylyltransferase
MVSFLVCPMETHSKFKSHVIIVNQSQSTGAIIVAAGTSQRMVGTDKLLALLDGKPVIAITVDLFERNPNIDAIVVVAGIHNIDAIISLSKEMSWKKVKKIVTGGQRRQDSVKLGLEALPPCEWVVVHDGARPLMPQNLIGNGLQAAHLSGAATAAVEIKDTVKIVDSEEQVIATPDRASIRTIQTPQIFRRHLLEKAHKSITDTVTDDASMVESIGVSVRLFPGKELNFKITTPIDLLIADALITTGPRIKQ